MSYVEFVIKNSGSLFVCRICPICKRYIRAGWVKINGLDQIKFFGWKCKKHGEFEPKDWFIE